MGTPDTIALVGRVLDGDEPARADLLEHLRPRLVLWAAARMSSRLRSKMEPEDLAQDILLALHKGMAGFHADEPEQFFGWMFKVAENRIRDAASHWGAKKRRTGPPLTFTQTSPSIGLMKQESFEMLHRALATLPLDYREVVRLRRMEELDVAQVAEHMGRTPNAVRVLYCRALKALRQAMPDTD